MVVPGPGSPPQQCAATRFFSRFYSKEARIPCIPHDENLPPPPPPPCDLTSAPEFDSLASLNEKIITQEICPVSYSPEVVSAMMEADKNLITQSFLDVKILKELFEDSVREALEIRGLLWPYGLEDSECTRCLHFEHEHILKNEVKLSYITTKRLMQILIGIPREFWRPLFDFLSRQRTIVYLDWSVDLSTSISYAIYDFGVDCSPDNISWYKSESDASWEKPEKTGQKSKEGQQGPKVTHGDIGLLIWKDRKVVWCELYKDFPCKSSVAAEAIGMYLQLRRSIGLDYLQAHTDNKTIRKVVVGKLTAGKDEEETAFFQMLRIMAGYFKRVVPRWVPREELKFVDGLLRNRQLMNTIRNKAEDNNKHEEERFITSGLMNAWKPHLRGDPIFTIIQGRGFRAGKYKGGYQMDYVATCVVNVKENSIDAIYHVIQALGPAKVSVISSESKAKELASGFLKLAEMLDLCFIEKTNEGTTTFSIELSPRFRDTKHTKDLVIVLGSSVPKESFLKNVFTVFLLEQDEKNKLPELPRFSPLSFLAFHRSLNFPLSI